MLKGFLLQHGRQRPSSWLVVPCKCANHNNGYALRMRRAVDAADHAEAQRAAEEGQAATLRSQLGAAIAAQQRLFQVEGALRTCPLWHKHMIRHTVLLFICPIVCLCPP